MSPKTPIIEIVAVSVGQPQQLGERNGQPVCSSIKKSPVAARQLLLTYTNLAGDQQVDTKPKPGGRQLHGGNEMAVYVYPAEHFPLWSRELERHVGPGTLGDNLAILGPSEREVHIGDQWQWGNALLEVSKPRQPCYKLTMIMGQPMIPRMRANGRCGWYLRVLIPGMVPTLGTIRITSRATDNPTVAERFAEKSQAKADD